MMNRPGWDETTTAFVVAGKRIDRVNAADRERLASLGDVSGLALIPCTDLSAINSSEPCECVFGFIAARSSCFDDDPAPCSFAELRGTLERARALDTWSPCAASIADDAAARALREDDVALYVCSTGALSGAELVFGAPCDLRDDDGFAATDVRGPANSEVHWGKRGDQLVRLRAVAGISVTRPSDMWSAARVDVSDDAHARRVAETSGVSPDCSYWLISDYD